MFADQEAVLASKFSPFYTTVINLLFWTLSLFPAVMSIWKIEGRKEYVSEAASDKVVDEKAEPVSKV